MEDKVRSFVEAVSIADVFLKDSKTNCHVLPRTLDSSSLELNFNFDFKFEAIKDASVLLTFLQLNVEALNNKSESIDFEISSTYVVVYDYSNYGEEPEDDLLEEFTRTTALFNAYPFLRECVTSLSVRMGIPPVIAPLLKFGKTKSKKKTTTTKKKNVK